MKEGRERQRVRGERKERIEKEEGGEKKNRTGQKEKENKKPLRMY